MIVLPYKLQNHIYIKKIISENIFLDFILLMFSGIWFFINIIPIIKNYFYFYSIKKKFNNNSKPFQFVIITIYYEKSKPFYYIPLKNYSLTITTKNEKHLFVVKKDDRNNVSYVIGVCPKNSNTAIVLDRKLSQLGGLSKIETSLLIKKIENMIPIAQKYV